MQQMSEDRSEHARACVVRTLCFFQTIEYAPTVIELLCLCDVGPDSASSFTIEEMRASWQDCCKRGVGREVRGRCILSGHESLCDRYQDHARFFVRKLRRARTVARWLSHIHGVRFVAVCNSTAWANAADASDLDFFVVTDPGCVWQARAYGATPFALFGHRPSVTHAVIDAVCLSFFVGTTMLDVSTWQLSRDDPYARYWFLSLLPFYDDGVGALFWEQNRVVRARHPFAYRWQLHPAWRISTPHLRVPSCAIVERMMRSLQERTFPEAIRTETHQRTHVIVNESMLKFHVQDRRAAYREQYEHLCAAYAIRP